MIIMGILIFFGVVGALLGYNYEKREALVSRVVIVHSII